MLKPIEQKNKEIELEEGEKKFSIINFLIGFLAWKKRIKAREECTEEVFVKLEKNLSNFQLTIDKKEKKYRNTVLLKLAKVEYQNIFNKNKSLKQEIELIKKQKMKNKNQKK